MHPMTGKQNASEPAAANHILLAEDDEDMRLLLATVLRNEGYLVTECKNGAHLLDSLSGLLLQGATSEFDLIISDIRMPGLTALEILEGLFESPNLPPVILTTAFGDKAVHQEAKERGAIATLDKPFDLKALLALLEKILMGSRDLDTEFYE